MAKVKLKANQSFDGIEGFVKSGEIFEVENEERAEKLVKDLKFADYTDQDAEVTQEHSLEDYTVPELKERAKDLNIQGYSTLLKDELITEIEKAATSERRTTSNSGAATTSSEPENATDTTNETAARTTNQTAADQDNTPAQLQTTKTGNEDRKK